MNKTLSDIFQFLRSLTRSLVAFLVYGSLAIILYKEFHSLPDGVIKKSSQKNHSPKSTSSNVVADFLTFDAKVEATPTPNKYEVKLSWTYPFTLKAWRIRRWDETGNSKNLVKLDGTETRYTDTEVTSGRVYRYLLIPVDQNGPAEKKQVRVIIPRDVVIQGSTDARDIQNANRLYLRRGARLLTNGQDLKINVSEIISEDALIETFPDAQTANEGKDGRGGGTIRISTRKGNGHLFIFGRGENGGKGIKGGNGKEGTKGINGHDAELGVRAEALRASDSDAKSPVHPTRELFFCKAQTEDGKQSSPGFEGMQGGAGGRGGDSPLIFVEVEDPTHLQVDPFVIPGRGDVGGEGGSGGAGGPSGEPGARDAFELCRVAYPGVHGQAGPKGRDGIKGIDGKEKPICLRMGSHFSPNCTPTNTNALLRSK